MQVSQQWADDVIVTIVGGDEMTGPWPGWITQSVHDAFAALCEQRSVDPVSADDADERVALWDAFCTMAETDLIALGARKGRRDDDPRCITNGAHVARCSCAQ